MSSQTTATAASSGFDRLKQIAPMPLMIVVLVIVIVAVIVYVVMRVKSGTLKSYKLLKTPFVKAHNAAATAHNVSSAAYFPDFKNGTQYTVSLWLFVDNVTITNTHKIVMYRGDSTSYTNGNFFVYMDAKTNRLYASLRSSGTQPDATEPALEAIRTNKYYMHSVIDYVPLQRWVNVVYTVKDTVFSTYLDGELYSVTSIYELPEESSGIRPTISKPIGDIMLSGHSTKPGFDGYIGTCNIYNFALTINEAKTVYKQGPYRRTMMSMFGMGNIGLRYPIYKLEDAKDTV